MQMMTKNADSNENETREEQRQRTEEKNACHQSECDSERINERIG